jgi:ATP-binding cassette subfamily C protein CydD
MMTTSSPDAGAPEWLRRAADPGRGVLRAAAACQVLETVFTIVSWTALARLAEGLLVGGARPGWSDLGLLVTGGLLAAAAAWAAARLQAAGRRRISGTIRRDLVSRLLTRGRHGTVPDAARASLAAVELADDVTDYHADVLPLRIAAPMSMAVIAIVTSAVHWPAAVILLLATVIVVPNLRLVGLFAKDGVEEQAAATGRLAAVVLDSFRGMRTLHSLGAVRRRRATLAEAADRLDSATMATVRRAFLSGAVMELVISYAIAVNATYIGLSLLGYLSIGAFPQTTLFNGLTALLLCPMYFAPMRALAAAFHARERAAAAAPAIQALLDGEPEEPDHRRPANAPSGPTSVSVERVSVTFAAASAPVLSEVSLTIDAGRWVAVTGPSGAGKTTLLSLIAGGLAPSSGSVRWRTSEGTIAPRLGGCAWIGQRTVIMPDSVAYNISLGRPDASRSEIERAAAAARLTDVVERLPSGLDTPLGEGGSGLSTGESRRIAIARALLRGAELWILDEPTAHLDPDAEARVMDSLRAAAGGRTVVIATHSATVARAADVVLAVRDGAVVQVREVVTA